MADDFQYDVFLSHSAKDKGVVRAVAERLRKDGLKVWFDEWVIPVAASRQSAAFSSESEALVGGKDGGALPRRRYDEMIEEGLEHSNFGFRISDFGFARPGMSANAFGSDWAQLQSNSQLSTFNYQRTGAPLNKERRFIPLRLDDAPITGSLAQFLCINWLPAKRDQKQFGADERSLSLVLTNAVEASSSLSEVGKN